MSSRTANPPTGIAFFDFDGTLIEGDSLLYFLEEIAGRWTARAAFAQAAVQAAFGSRRLGADRMPQDYRTRVKALVLNRLLNGVSLDDCRRAGDRVARRLRWNQTMLDRLTVLRSEGWSIVLATGALDVLLPALLPSLGPLDGILATEMAVENGCLTGIMATSNCVRAEKARRVGEWLAKHHGGGQRPASIAYGNRPSDIPMMAVVDRGVIVRLHRGQQQPELTDYAGR